MIGVCPTGKVRGSVTSRGSGLMFRELSGAAGGGGAAVCCSRMRGGGDASARARVRARDRARDRARKPRRGDRARDRARDRTRETKRARSDILLLARRARDRTAAAARIDDVS